MEYQILVMSKQAIKYVQEFTVMITLYVCVCVYINFILCKFQVF